MVGVTKLWLFIVKLKVVLLYPISRFRLTSAAPGRGIPGAAGLQEGWRFVSNIGLVDGTSGVVGSMAGAPVYLRIAELMPFWKPVVPTSGLARTQ